MKRRLFISICALALLLLSACAEKQEQSTMSEARPSAQENATTEPDNATGGEPGSQEEYIQLWSADEFRQNEEDVMFFVPATDDYMLTEVYGLEQPDTGIVYTLTILRSFDESGTVISQIDKYSFDIPPDARFCYDTFKQDGTDYPMLICVGYSVYVEPPADIVAEQRTKAQFISDYQADSTKHWLSIP